MKYDTVAPEEIMDAGDGDGADKSPEKKHRGSMTEKEFQELVFTQAKDARLFVDSAVSLDRSKATDYYKGRLPDIDKDDANEDRSTVVLTEVRDVVLGMLPDLMRVFFSADGVCAYRPVATEDPEQFKKNEDEAANATGYVQNVVLGSDNPDFFITAHDAFKDALVRKTGFLKWWWETSKKPAYSHYTGLTEEQVLVLASDEEVTIVDKSLELKQDAILGPIIYYDVTLKRVCDYGKIRIAGVPCENVLVAGTARSVGDAPLIGYTEEWNAGDFLEHKLIDSLDDIKDCDQDPQDESSTEANARRPRGMSVLNAEKNPPEDPSQRKVQYAELFVIADFDGDSIPELRRVQTAGTRFKVLKNEPWDEVNLAAFCPYPEAHTFYGESAADLVMDLQRIKSRIMRDMLDSLAQSVKPQMSIVEGQVNIDDVLNPDTSNVVRMRAPGMVQPITIPFVGKEALPVIDMLTNIRENRTGMSDASQGLSPKDLQSADADAVQNTLTKGAARIELIARVFAETGMKRLFRGVLKCLKEHQTVSRTVALRGKPTPIDPRQWNADMAVETTIPLGRGSQQMQSSFLASVLAQQEKILQTLGPDNPLVDLEKYRFTWAKILELNGWRNTESFVADPAKLTPEEKKAVMDRMMASLQKAASGGQSGPAAPDPQVEMAKIASNEKIKIAELQSKQAEAAAKLEFQRVELQAQMEIEVLKAQIARQTTLDETQVNAMVKHAGDRLSAATKIAVEKLKPRGGADNGGTAAN